MLFSSSPWISVRFLPPMSSTSAHGDTVATAQHMKQLGGNKEDLSTFMTQQKDDLKTHYSQFTEGDLAVVFSQFGEVVDVRFRRTGKQLEFTGKCYVRYEDPRSCILATDNMNCPVALRGGGRSPPPQGSAATGGSYASSGLKTKSAQGLVQLTAANFRFSELGPIEVDHVEASEVPPLHDGHMSYGEWYEKTQLRTRSGTS